MSNPTASAEIAAAAAAARKKHKLTLPLDDPRLADRAKTLTKLRAEANGLAARIDTLRTAQAALQRAITEGDAKAQLSAERTIATVGAPLAKLTSSLVALADRMVALEAEQELAFAEVTAELVAPWWAVVDELRSRSAELVRQAGILSHAASALAHERTHAFEPAAVGINTPSPWRATLRALGHATESSR